MTPYDFLIVGGGLAGLSLACRLAETPAFDRCSILIVEQDAKTRNDRTFSFWSDQPSLFNAAISRSWDRLRVAGPSGVQDLALGDYRYHTIRGLDFYRHAQQRVAQHANVELRRGHVQRIDDGPDAATVVVDGEAITATWVFDSRPPRLAAQADDRHTRLKLYFRGWEIQTPTAVFDPGIATFMDFRTPQDGDVRFFYVLPFAPDRALVEYTLFTDQRLTREETEQAIVTYMQSTLGIDDFRVVAEEGGCLPITDAPCARRLGQRVLAIGVNGGRIKPSTGYAFSRVQADSQAIVRSLLDHGHPFGLADSQAIVRSLLDHGHPFGLAAGPASYRWLDAVMLRVMRDHGELIAPAFAALFSRNPTARILRFLDEQATAVDILRIMASLPAGLFAGTALEMAVGRIGKAGKEGKDREEGKGEMHPRKLRPV